MDCEGCTECCRWLVFHLDMPTEDRAAAMAFYRARGCTVKDLGDSFSVAVPTVCPSLTQSGCILHNTSLKPKVCREYDCKHDEFLPNNPRR
jgi:hypothetical protein